MAIKDHKVNEAIRIVYQPDGAKTGETVTTEIFDETGAKDVVNFPDLVHTEIGTTGRYEGQFTPDTEGNWTTMTSYSSGKGKVVRNYSVGGYNVDSIGTIVDEISTTVSTISIIDSPAMLG
jgi:hypothetical protein